MNPLKSRKAAKRAEPQLLVASTHETQGTIKVPHRLTEVLCKKTLEDKNSKQDSKFYTLTISSSR